MIIANAAHLNAYLNKPKKIILDDDCQLYVKQLKVAEFDALKTKCEALDSEGADASDVGPSIDIIASLITDDAGKLLFTSEEDIAALKDNLTLDFVRKFFDKFWQSFAFTSKELASAEAQFRQ